MTASAPPPRPYLGVETERPPPYVPNQDLQQVQVTVKESVVEVEIEGLDLLKEQIKLLTARLDNREGQAPPGGAKTPSVHGSEGNQSKGSQGDSESDEESEGGKEEEGLRIVIKGTMNVDGEVTFPIAERTRSREDKKKIYIYCSSYN